MFDKRGRLRMSVRRRGMEKVQVSSLFQASRVVQRGIGVPEQRDSNLKIFMPGEHAAEHRDAAWENV
jgi:hypothetical protein